MKTKSLLLMLAIVFAAVNTSLAGKLRVNNSGGGAPYTTIADAVAAAIDGDTIYVDGSSANYSGLTLTKRVVIIGPGYFLGSNPETQAHPSNATINTVLNFNAGSEGSIIMGMHFTHSLNINTNNIVVKRNRFSSSSSTNFLTIGSSVNNIIISQNFMSLSYNCISISTNATGILIMNNYIETTSPSYHLISMSATSEASIYNNILSGGGRLSINNSSVHNNIVMSTGTNSFSNNMVANNVCSVTQFPAPNNLQNVVMILVFDLSDPSPDGQYRLIDDPTNPAIGYGLTGIDCGMFGGPDPYRLSGIPNVPAIYQFFAPATGSVTGGLPTDIKIKSNH